jgi:hypothetical protein
MGIVSSLRWYQLRPRPIVKDPADGYVFADR